MWTLSEELKQILFINANQGPRLKLTLGETTFPEELSVIIMKLVLKQDSYSQKCVIRSVCTVWRKFVLQYSPRAVVMLNCSVVTSSNTFSVPIGVKLGPTRIERICQELKKDVKRGIPLQVIEYVMANNRWLSPSITTSIYESALGRKK